MPLKPFPIEWNKIPHSEISLPQGKWKFPENESFGAMIFTIVNTSRQMGLTVGEFLELPQDEKAIQITYTQIMSKIEGVNAQDREDQMRRKSKAK